MLNTGGCCVPGSGLHAGDTRANKTDSVPDDGEFKDEWAR